MEFISLLLYQPADGYCYNSDTLFLYDFISSFSPKGKVLDVGAGSGVLGLLIAKNHKITLEAVEKQNQYAFFAKKNATLNGINYHLFESDFLNLSRDHEYDYIVSNPPFYHDNVIKSTNELKHAARYNSHLPLNEFFEHVKHLLKPRGVFIFCYDPQQLQSIVRELDNAKLTMENMRFVYPKRGKRATLVMIKTRKNSKSLVQVEEPLYAFEENEFSEEAKKIYKKTGTHSIKCTI